MVHSNKTLHINGIYLYYLVEKRKENIIDLPRQGGGQKKKMGKHTSDDNQFFPILM